MATRVLFVVVVVALLGCKEKITGAGDKFGTKYSCPADQVSIKPRTDIDAATVLGPHITNDPPDEVKADPARLAKYNADQDAKRANWAGSYSDYEMFEVTGCGHDVIMGCHHPTNARGATREDLVSCEEAKDEAKEREKEAAKAEKQKAKEDAKAAKREAKQQERDEKERARAARTTP